MPLKVNQYCQDVGLDLSESSLKENALHVVKYGSLGLPWQQGIPSLSDKPLSELGAWLRSACLICLYTLLLFSTCLRIATQTTEALQLHALGLRGESLWEPD